MASNTVVVNPSAEDTEQALRAFEASTKTALHSVVRQSLSQLERGTFHVPSVGAHGSYIFGSVYAPTSALDGKPDLTRVVCLVSRESSLFIIGSATQGAPISDSIVSAVRRAASSEDSPANSLLGVLEAVINELCLHHEAIEYELSAAEQGIQRSSRLRSGRAAAELASCQSKLRVAAGELVNIEPIVEAMGEISSAIAGDRLDVRSQGRSELFGENSEIRSQHLADRCKQIIAATRGASRSLAEMQIAFQVQMSDLRFRVTQLLTALATLFLTPVILLYVYSQFLAEGQSWSNEFTANYFWIVAVGAAVAEAIFFRAKKWLR